jgi:hypothetical protein
LAQQRAEEQRQAAIDREHRIQAEIARTKQQNDSLLGARSSSSGITTGFFAVKAAAKVTVSLLEDEEAAGDREADADKEVCILHT